MVCMRFSLKRTMEALGGDDTRDRKRRNTASMFDPPRLVRPVLGRMREVLHERQAKRRDNGCLYARVIQRFWRTYGGLSARIVNNTEDSGHLGNVRCGGKDVVCPITQEAIPWRSVAKFVTEAGAVVAYTAPQLIEYLLSSGNFNCCLTRTPFRLSFVWRLSQKPVRGAERLLMVYADRQSILARAIEHDTAATVGYPLLELISSPMHERVIGAANRPHPGLLFDSGKGQVVLELSATEEMLRATFHRPEEVIFEVTRTAVELARR